MQRVPQDSRALELAKLDNPEYGCIYDWMMLSRVPILAPRSTYPFPLDGAAWDRKETGVILMQRILYKMILINHPVVRVCKEEVGELKDLLAQAAWLGVSSGPQGSTFPPAMMAPAGSRILSCSDARGCWSRAWT